MNSPYTQRNERQRAYALLTALIVSALMVSIATGIASITVRQLRTHSLIADSYTAQNAATAGYECAYFWDTDPAVIEAQHLGPFYPSEPARDIACFNDPANPANPLPVSVDKSAAGAAGGTIYFASNVGEAGCTEVVVNKTWSGAEYADILTGNNRRLYETTITADGYNSRLLVGGGPGGISVCDKSGGFTVQRTVFVDPY